MYKYFLFSNKKKTTPNHGVHRSFSSFFIFFLSFFLRQILISFLIICIIIVESIHHVNRGLGVFKLLSKTRDVLSFFTNFAHLITDIKWLNHRSINYESKIFTND